MIGFLLRGAVEEVLRVALMCILEEIGDWAASRFCFLPFGNRPADGLL